jgi:Ser/Thr protein kinase RdoA (MazF antagonist)
VTSPNDAHRSSRLASQVERHWPLGKIARIRRIPRGLVNQTFRIDTGDGQRCILRLYQPEVTTARIHQEHALLRRLDDVGFALSPRLILPTKAPTWKPLAPPLQGHRYMALTTHLPGEDRYAWDQPPRQPGANRALGRVLARYHRAIFGWRGERGDAAALEAQTLRRLAATLEDDPLAAAAQERLGRALTALDRDAWPALTVHGDFHAANVRWSGDTITGLFDFEYAGHNWRLYDVATSIASLAFPWAPSREGPMAADLMQSFLDGYKDALDPPLPPFQGGELAALPHYLALAQLLTLEWALAPGTRSRLSAATAARYVRHARRALAWLQQAEISL